jgi:hypothetical protein
VVDTPDEEARVERFSNAILRAVRDLARAISRSRGLAQQDDGNIALFGLELTAQLLGRKALQVGIEQDQFGTTPAQHRIGLLGAGDPAARVTCSYQHVGCALGLDFVVVDDQN